MTTIIRLNDFDSAPAGRSDTPAHDAGLSVPVIWMGAITFCAAFWACVALIIAVL